MKFFKQAGRVVGFCFFWMAFYFVGFGFFLQSPIYKLSHLSAVARISFPSSAQLVTATYRPEGIDHYIYAKVRILRSDLPAFEEQEGMDSFVLSSPPLCGSDDNYACEMKRGMDNHGCGVTASPTLRYANFRKGYYGSVWITQDDPKWATVYIHSADL